MKNKEVVYQDQEIEITKRYAFGKIALSAINKKSGATCTAFAINDADAQRKMSNLIMQVKKSIARINLTPRIERIEQETLKYLTK